MKNDELHLRSPKNWINDPNGFIYYKGKYHLFYQHFPYAPVWGTMHWGHAVSENLIHWEHQDIALFPTKGYDQNGIFSGSAIEVDGNLYLYYSAVKYLEIDSENIHIARNEQFETSQAMIISQDGFHFDNWKDKKMVIPVSTDEEKAHRMHTRDPKVWKEGDTYYMVLGSTYMETIGRVVFYTSKDGINWEFKTQLRNKKFGRIMECPDIFKVGDNYIMEGAAMDISDPKDGYPHNAICSIVDFEPGECRLILPEDFRYVDYGLDLYAPQTNLDKDGRRVMIGWMRMPKPIKEDNSCEWTGMMSLPRVIEIENGHIYYRVHPEVRKYFNQSVPSVEKIDFSKPFCLKMRIKDGEAIDIGGYHISMDNQTVCTDRSKVFAGLKDYSLKAQSPKICKECELEIFVDENLIEIFINDGEYVISQIVYGLGDNIDTSCCTTDILCYNH